MADEAIISEEDWYLAQEKRKINSFRREKVNNPDHAHILSGILKCPCYGKSMYGNIAKAHSKDRYAASSRRKSPAITFIGSYWHLMKSTIPQQKRNRKSL